MCRTCESSAAGRRQFLKFAAGGLAAITLAGPMGEARAAEGAPTTLSPDEALAQLKSGNERYVRQPELCSVDLAQKRESVAGHQAPWATIIACADSRSPPELVFGGLEVGELFVARNAGNLVDTATLGTVEYGAAVLGSPLIVVLAAHELRRGEGGLRRRNQERDLSRRDRRDDRADPARSPRGARRTRRLCQQRSEAQRAENGGEARVGEHAHFRSRRPRASSRSSPRSTIFRRGR